MRVLFLALMLFAGASFAEVEIRAHEGVEHLAAGLRENVPTLLDRARLVTGAKLKEPIIVHLVQDNEKARALLPAWHLPPWAAGAARPEAHTIVLTVHNDGQRHDRERVLLHEFAHLAIYEAAGGKRLPRWFDEGVARRIAGEDGVDDDRVLARAKIASRLIPLKGLRVSFPAGKDNAAVAYAVSGRAIELLEVGDPKVVENVLLRVKNGEEFEAALEAEAGFPVWRLFSNVEESVQKWHAWLTLLREVDIFMGLASVLVITTAFFALRRRKKQREDMPDDVPTPLLAASRGISLFFWRSR